jgi:hypothetical protein
MTTDALQDLIAKINEAAASPERLTDEEVGQHFQKRLNETEK